MKGHLCDDLFLGSDCQITSKTVLSTARNMDVTSLLDQELPRARRNGSPWSASSAAQRQLGVEALHEIDAETMATKICEVHSRTHGI